MTAALSLLLYLSVILLKMLIDLSIFLKKSRKNRNIQKNRKIKDLTPVPLIFFSSIIYRNDQQRVIPDVFRL